MTVNRTEPARRRVSVPLDPEVLIEALILTRLETLPKRRQPDWVRGLLVQGFLAESRVLRSLQAGASVNADKEHRWRSDAPRGFTFGERFRLHGPAEPAEHLARDTGRRERPGPANPDGPDKPFAHLRKVVG